MSQTELLDPHANGKLALALPGPEVRPKAKPRQFSAENKKRILKEAHACRQHGHLGALLRREGPHSSHLSSRRSQRSVRGERGLKWSGESMSILSFRRQEDLFHLEEEAWDSIACELRFQLCVRRVVILPDDEFCRKRGSEGNFQQLFDDSTSLKRSAIIKMRKTTEANG